MNGKRHCIGRCAKHKAARVATDSPYEMGLGRCKTCQIYMNVDCNFCPCCKNKLRFSPKAKNRVEVARIG